MRILHTSDWHVGRTFHGHPTLAALDTVLDALAKIVRARKVDVVVIAGDVFDLATPSADAYRSLERALTAIRDAGAVVVLSSGNHDSAARLGFQSSFTALAGVHVVTRPEQLDVPIVLDDEHGPVHFFAIPYLEPALLRHRWPDVPLRSQADALTFAMDRIRAAAPDGERRVVLAHTFVSSGANPSDDEVHAAQDAPRDFTQGGIDVVPLSAFEDVTYVALGHLHSRSRIADHARYCGAPLHYSFGEAHQARGTWVVDLDASGLADVEWVDLPIPRRLAVLTGTLDELLTDPAYDDRTDFWVRAILTDNSRPMDAMRQLQVRFPHCAQLEHRPAVAHRDGHSSYSKRVRAKPDDEITATFLEFVRNGEGPTETERRLILDAMAAQRAKEVSA